MEQDKAIAPSAANMEISPKPVPSDCDCGGADIEYGLVYDKECWYCYRCRREFSGDPALLGQLQEAVRLLRRCTSGVYHYQTEASKARRWLHEHFPLPSVAEMKGILADVPTVEVDGTTAEGERQT